MADPAGELAPLFRAETAPPIGQAVAPPGTWRARGAGEGAEERENETVHGTQPAAMTAVTTVSPKQVATTTTTTAKLTENYADLQKCTVVVTLQFYPPGGDGQARRVLLSIQNGAGNQDDLPLLAVITEDELGGPLPPALLELWRRLEADMPRRKQRHEERAAARATVAKTIATPTSAKKHGVVATATRNTATPPPPPTTTAPIQKEELTMGGLFDGV